MTWRATYVKALTEGNNSRVTQNVAPIGGGVYLLGEKAALATGSQHGGGGGGGGGGGDSGGNGGGNGGGDGGAGLYPGWYW